jgi:hypothetical protein
MSFSLEELRPPWYSVVFSSLMWLWLILFVMSIGMALICALRKRPFISTGLMRFCQLCRFAQWATFSPLLIVALYGLLFEITTKVDREMIQYILIIMAVMSALAHFAWTYSKRKCKDDDIPSPFAMHEEKH